MTSRSPLPQGILVIRSIRRLAMKGLLVSTLTLLLLSGCNSNSRATAKNQSNNNSTSSIENDSTDNSEVREANRPGDKPNSLEGKKENTADQSGSSENATIDKNADDSNTDEAIAAATKSDETQIAEAKEELPPFRTFELLASMEAGYSSVDALAFAPDGESLVTCADTPKIWEIGATEPLYEFDGIYPLTGTVVEPEAVTISNDGKLLAFAGGDGIIYLFEYASREAKHEITAHEAGVVSLSFSNDRKRLASSGYDGKAKVWDTETGNLIATCNAQDERRVRSAISPDGSYLVTAGDEADIWDVSLGKKKATLNIGEPRQMGVWFVDISNDGRKIVTGDATRNFENAALVWSADSGKLQATLSHEYGVGLVDVSPDGQWLATGDMNGAARIWRLADNQLVQTITIEDVFGIDAIQWTPDSKVLAVSSDGTIRFWGPPGALNPVEGDQGNKSDDDMPDSSETTPNTVDQVTEENQPDSTQATADAQSSDPEASQDWRNPALLSDAMSAIDLRTFPRLPDANAEDFNVHITDLYYEAPGKPDDVIAFYQGKLTENDWNALPVAAGTNQRQDLVREFTRNGFHLTLMASPASGKDRVTVNLTNFGNLDVSKLPRPDDAKTGYESSQYVQLQSGSSAVDALNFIREKLIEAGYAEVRNYHDSEDNNELRSQYEFIKNATCVTVYPNRKRKGCEINYGCRMLKFNTPLSPDATKGVMNDDSEFSLKYTSSSSANDLTEFYQSRAESFGWSFVKDRSNISDNAPQLCFDDANTNQTIVVTMLPNDEGKMTVAIEGEITMKEQSNSKLPDTVAGIDSDMPARQQDEAMEDGSDDTRKVLIDAQKQLVDNLKIVDPEKAREIEAELQKMIDMASATDNPSNDNSDPDAQAEIASSKFPVPDGATDVTRDEDSGLIKYMADLKIEEHAGFYRNFFSEKGWKESEPDILDSYAKLTFENEDLSIEIWLIEKGSDGQMKVTIRGNGISWKTRSP